MHFEAIFSARIGSFSAKVRQSCSFGLFSLQSKQLQPDYVSSCQCLYQIISDLAYLANEIPKDSVFPVMERAGEDMKSKVPIKYLWFCKSPDRKILLTKEHNFDNIFNIIFAGDYIFISGSISNRTGGLPL